MRHLGWTAAAAMVVAAGMLAESWAAQGPIADDDAVYWAVEQAADESVTAAASDEKVRPADPREGVEFPKGAYDLPKPLFEGTPKNINEKNLRPARAAMVKPAMPLDCTNLARGKGVTSSDSEPIIGDLKLITDGDKEGIDGSYVELGPGKHWVQIDLKTACEIHIVHLWHYHREGRVYRDVVVQVADDADFIENVRTLYNNDYDNSSGLGIGKDLQYVDGYEGEVIEAKGVKARYIRLSSNGNTSNDQNHYTEVEVWGK